MRLDVLVIGGGIAGLWLLDEVRRMGFQALLIEARALGSGQTIASQGILHGGLKHAFGGRLSSFVDALKGMPEIWRECLIGAREPDLRSVRLRGDCCYCWRTDSLGSAFGQWGARLGLRIGFNRITDENRPVPLKYAPGNVFRIEEQVVDPASLIAAFSKRNRSHILLAPSIRFAVSRRGTVNAVFAQSPDGAQSVELRPSHIVLAAGEGNRLLREACGLSVDAMRLLPLPIVTLRGDLPTLNGFCLDGTKAKVVVTTHRIREHDAVWQVASERVEECSSSRFMPLIVQELKEALPKLSLANVTIDSYLAQRAEIANADDSRPSDVHLTVEGNVITVWPTKLVLAPRLANRVLQILPAPSHRSIPDAAFHGWPRPTVALFPWESIT